MGNNAIMSSGNIIPAPNHFQVETIRPVRRLIQQSETSISEIVGFTVELEITDRMNSIELKKKKIVKQNLLNDDTIEDG
jgi:hypothetical protein